MTLKGYFLRLVKEKIKDVPEEKAKIESGAIQSVSYDENILVVVVLDQETSNYKMQIYNMKGEQLSEVPLSKDYAQIKVSKNQILLYEGDMFAIYTKDGICKYSGEMDTGILEMYPLFGLNKYMMINANGFYEIRLVK